MKVLILAAGFGTRLRPITNDIPKCLVQIKGKPLLEIWLEKLSKVKCGPFLINTHYLAEKVELFIKNSRYSENVSLVYEPNLEGTAGTLLKNIDFFDDGDGILIHADNYCADNLRGLIEAHKKRPKECLITMLVFRTKTPSTCGIVEIDNDGVMINFHEKKENPPGDLANGAIYILSSSLIKTLQKDFANSKEFTIDIVSKLKGRIYTYKTKDFFIDIGSPENYNEANHYTNYPA